MVEGNRLPAPEVLAFLPLDDNNKTHDVESAKSLTDSKEFNPFKERKTNNPTTDGQTLIHLLKSTLGSGITTMPYAFKSAGVIGGSLGVLFMMIVCTHTSYVLVDCAHKLYYKTRKTKMEYADIVEAAFATGPPWSRKFTKFARYFLQIWLFSAYFGASSTDNLLIASNFGQVIRFYTQQAANATGTMNTTDIMNATVAAQLDILPDDALKRTIMGGLLPLLILFVWVPDLKYLAPISMVANIFMVTGLGITFYYLVQDPLPIGELSLTRPIAEFPVFFSVTLFAMENIGVMMPLENNMATPQNFLGTCGVLNRGMFGITFVYLALGLLGYMKYGNRVNEIITTNLPVVDVQAQIVKILIGSTVLLTFGLQFYVCHEMVWNRIKKYFPNRPILAEYSVRTALLVACVLLAIAIPRIGPLVTLIGALGFSIIGLLYPAVIEIVVYWDIGLGRFNWKIYKNVIIILVGIMAAIFGSKFAVEDIRNQKW